MSTQRPDLTKSTNVGVQWQAQFEEHLADVRALTNEAMLQGLNRDEANLRAQLAQANAQAALALAVISTGGDIAHAIENRKEQA